MRLNLSTICKISKNKHYNQLLLVMKTTYILLFILFIIVFAPNTKISAHIRPVSADTTANVCLAHDTIAKVVVQKNAQFDGGDLNKFMHYVMSNIRYPVESLMNHEQGKSYVAFIVDWDGQVKNVSVYKSSGYKRLDDEAVRIVSHSPIWISAKNDSLCVPQKFNIPVTFRSMGIVNRIPRNH